LADERGIIRVVQGCESPGVKVIDHEPSERRRIWFRSFRMKPQIKYVERKIDGLRGLGRIVRVSFSQKGKTIYCGERTLAPLHGHACKANYYDVRTLEEFWVSNPHRDGHDALLSAIIEIDADVREEYWSVIRREPSQSQQATYRSPGKTKRERERLEKSVRRHDIDRRFRAPRTSQNTLQ
jgi:hypothetical protein